MSPRLGMARGMALVLGLGAFGCCAGELVADAVDAAATALASAGAEQVAAVAVAAAAVVTVCLLGRASAAAPDGGVTVCVVDKVVGADGEVGLPREVAASAMDVMVGAAWVTFAFRFDNTLDPDELERGLARALRSRPEAGARLRFREGRYWLVVLDGAEGGAQLQVVRKRRTAATRWPGPDSCKEEWVRAELFPDGPGFFKALPGPREPLVKVRVTLVEGAPLSFVGVSISHALYDAQACCDFMQAWARGCSGGGGFFPDGRGLERRAPERAAEKKASLEELARDWNERVLSHVECKAAPPVAPWLGNLRLALPLLRSKARNTEVELVVSIAKTRALANRAGKLSADGWVSPFEAVMGALLAAHHATLPGPSPHLTCVNFICNLRGRTSELAPGFRGNGLTDVFTQLGVDPRSPERTAAALHGAVRRELAGGAAHLGSIVAFLERVSAMGMQSSLYMSSIEGTLRGENVYMNSWAKYPWLDIRFGGRGPTAFSLASDVLLANMLLHTPRTVTQHSVHICVPRVDALIDFLEQHDTPVERILQFRGGHSRVRWQAKR